MVDMFGGEKKAGKLEDCRERMSERKKKNEKIDNSM